MTHPTFLQMSETARLLHAHHIPGMVSHFLGDCGDSCLFCFQDVLETPLLGKSHHFFSVCSPYCVFCNSPEPSPSKKPSKMVWGD